MRVLLIIVAGGCLLASILAQQAAPQQERKVPLMVSFTDLKWVELPERKGMHSPCSQAIPKQGHMRKFAKSLPVPTIRSIHIVVRSPT
jgi:hypothetical protein